MYVTLNISATSIRLLSVKGKQIQKWVSMPLAPGLVRDGAILQPKALGAAINALFNSMKVPKKRVITSLTGLSFTYRILSLPRMNSDLLEEAILRGARKEIPLPLEELYLSWQAIGARPDELDFFVLGVPQNLIDAMVETVAETGIKHCIMDLKPLALARAANRGNALIVDFEAECFDIVLVADGIPAIMHTITPREGASIEDNIGQLTRELSKTVEFYNSSRPENPLSHTTPLLLTGELSTDATNKLIQAETEYPVELLTPPLESPPYLPVTSYITNMGLALKEMPQTPTSKGEVTPFRDVNLDILSGKQRAIAPPVPLRRRLAPLAIIIVIGLLFPMYHINSQAGAETARLQTELSSVSQELRESRLTSIEVSEIEDTISEVAAEVDVLKEEHQDILSDRGYFTNTLSFVAYALPSQAYFTYIEVGTDHITVNGKADSSLTVIDYAMALERRGEFSEIRIAELNEVQITETEITDMIDITGIHTVDVNGLSGTFTIPEGFTVTDLTISPPEVDIGESVTISVLITNTRDFIDTCEVILKMDGIEVATEEITLDGGTSQTVTFTAVPGTEVIEDTGVSFTIIISR